MKIRAAVDRAVRNPNNKLQRINLANPIKSQVTGHRSFVLIELLFVIRAIATLVGIGISVTAKMLRKS